jgi:hypothetical protein
MPSQICTFLMLQVRKKEGYENFKLSQMTTW